MTKSDWLTVAMVAAVIMSAIATLLAPVLAVYAQSRISQHKPKPAPAQAGNAIQRFWRFLDLKQHWPILVGMLVGLAAIGMGYIRAKNTMDRRSVAIMMLGMATYICFGMLFVIFKVADHVGNKIDKITDSRKPQPLKRRR